jgi:uncharacterized membrane protein YdjX (TVP38/TMEM64 family)
MTTNDDPLFSVLWSLLLFAIAGRGLIVIWTFVDNFRRRHHRGWTQTLRFLLTVLAPVIEVLADSTVRPADRCPTVTDG